MKPLLRSAVDFFLILLVKRRQIRRMGLKNKKRIWTSQLFKKKDSFGTLSLVDKLRTDTIYKLKDYLRMDESVYSEILNKLRPKLEKNSRRGALSPKNKLLITLDYLIEDSTLEWLATQLVWWCLGAIDGKHISIKKPPKSGSNYINYKKFFPIILFVVADSNCKFLYAGFGINGRASDGGVFANCQFKKKLENNELNLPVRREGGPPFVFVADAAFPLLPYLIKPFQQRSLTPEKLFYIYRVTRCRRVIENAFGILSNRFRCLMKAFQTKTSTTKLIVTSCCILHNILITRKGNDYLRSDLNTPSILLRSITDYNSQLNISTTTEANNVREYYLNYFNTVDAVPFQYDILGKQERRALEERMEINQ